MAYKDVHVPIPRSYTYITKLNSYDYIGYGIWYREIILNCLGAPI